MTSRSDFLKRNRKQLGILLCCAVLVVLTRIDPALMVLTRIPGTVSFPFLALLFAIFLPARMVYLSVWPALAVLVGIAALNARKVAALGLPIMYFDLKMIVADPTVIINAVGADRRVIAAVAVGALVVIALALLAVLTLHFRTTPARRSSLLLTVLCLVVVPVAGWASLRAHGRFVHANLPTLHTGVWQAFWLPESQARLARKLAVPEYVAFTYFAGADDTGRDLSDVPPVPPTEALSAAMLLFGGGALPLSAVLPNVVIYHAESTFDPNLAFRLSAPVELPIWSRLPDTQLLGPLRVNVLGGGSWVTEFEVLTGVDSRIFGYQGFYTHYYLAPAVVQTFAHYLAQRGYRTTVFYSAESSFYNAESAFRQYGFNTFVDSRELGMPEEWMSLRDSAIVRAVVERGAFDETQPFFHFISSAENHGPHPCTDAPVVATFAGGGTRGQECQLNEYVRRARSTSAAFENILQQLQRLERTTGRPYVLLVYGDHQPWSFTEGMYSVAGGTAITNRASGFANVRTSADGYQTFFHLVSSIALPQPPRFHETVPVWLLPSLASYFVARSYDELYLPATFYAFGQCGSEIVAESCAASAAIEQSMRSAVFSSSRSHPVFGSRAPD